MADRDYNRRPRWTNTGYWTDRPDEEPREGDRSRSRNYSREDMRRYARRSTEQGQRLRDLRGQRRENWDNESRYGRGAGMDRDPTYGGDYGGNYGEREPYRGYGTTIARGQGWDRDREEDWNRQSDRGGQERWFDRGQSDRDQDLVDNYWGQREQNRQYRGQDRGISGQSGRPGFTSARRSWQGADRSQQSDWDESDYDFDPGFGYEFGTDYDFLDDFTREDINRRQSQGQQRRFDRGQQMGQRTQRMGRGVQYGWEGDPYNQEYRYREFWNVPGPYAGIGPNSYKRSDERITEEICEIFTYNGQIDATGIDLEVKDGEVILRGDVDRRDEKYLAEDIAASVHGVKDVTNQIRVQADDGARVRGMGNENVVMIGRIQEGLRVAGVDGKHIGKVREVGSDGFWLDRADGGQVFVPFRAVKRTNGQIILHIASNQIDQQNWKS